MPQASQFSLEEENFYKDIQDLLKKGSQNEKELSTFLGRYINLLSRADLDEHSCKSFVINFTKAAFILEASTKVYGNKVDRLWSTLERVLDSLKVKGSNTRKRSAEEDGGDDAEDVETEAVENVEKRQRRKRRGDELSSPDDFVEIDNVTGLIGKNMNEPDVVEPKIKFHEKIPTLFIKNKTERSKVDVCLIKLTDDRDDSRLGDWVISLDMMLVKEMFTNECPGIEPLQPLEVDILGNDQFTNDDVRDNLDDTPEPVADSLAVAEEGGMVEPNNNSNTSDKENAEPCLTPKIRPVSDKVTEEELQVFRNIRNSVEGNLVDIGDSNGLWNHTQFRDVIPSKKMRAGKTTRPPCKLCAKNSKHKRSKPKACMPSIDNLASLDSFFNPHVQPLVSEPKFAFLPNVELYSLYKVEERALDHMMRINREKNANQRIHQKEDSPQLQNFLDFEGFDNYLTQKKVGDDFDDGDTADDGLHDDPGTDFVEEKDLALPFPISEADLLQPIADLPDDMRSNASHEKSQLEYQNILLRELRDQNEAKSSFEKNRELGMKISVWHSSLTEKLELCRERGALNMDVLAAKIMGSFMGSSDSDACKPELSFKEMVRHQDRRDVPRFFLACLQLTNEGNLDIHKSDPRPLAKDCMVLRRLRASRIRQELDDYTAQNSPQKRKSPAKPRRMPSATRVTPLSDDEDEMRWSPPPDEGQPKRGAIPKKSRKRRSNSYDDDEENEHGVAKSKRGRPKR